MITLVPEGHWAIRERFGRFKEILEPGAHLWMPYLFSVKKFSSWNYQGVKKGFLIEKSEQQSSTQARHCQTKDHISLNVSASVHWKIIDPKKAAYSVDNLPQMVTQTALNTLRATISTLSFDAIFQEPKALCDSVASNLSPMVSDWGVEVIRIQLQELTYSKSVEKALLKWIEADQERKAKLALASAESEALIMKAQAQAKYAQISSESEYLTQINEAKLKAEKLEIQAKADRQYLQILKDEVHSDLASELLALRSKA